MRPVTFVKTFSVGHAPWSYLWQSLDEQQRQVELKREARLREIQEKQRLREDRGKRARERVSCVLLCCGWGRGGRGG